MKNENPTMTIFTYFYFKKKKKKKKKNNTQELKLGRKRGRWSFPTSSLPFFPPMFPIYRCKQMAQRNNGTAAKWQNGTMAQRHNGTTAQRQNGKKKICSSLCLHNLTSISSPRRFSRFCKIPRQLDQSENLRRT
ncbi:hypothetical protein POVWA2_002260 [Plasmodium ovale wallikeri]|uniref:Uncharacterized protein n=1 Tax=Plasmodium ovale wallikeri TaxID=864142 RepID=A0A1A8YHQ8_PLAOA|nr:hypothetical protein POVWA2_002260 [Plasmodium ovale wallikeri]